MLKKLILAAFAFQVSACSVYTHDDRPDKNLKGRDPNSEKESKFLKRGQCKKGRESSCLEGQIVVSQVALEGNQYFDAASLMAAMKSQVVVKDKNGAALAADAFELTIEKAVTNENFSEGFEAYLKGERVRSLNLDQTGHFSFDYLEEGNYRLRVQKRFAAKVADKRAVAAPGSTTVLPVVPKDLCIYVFADSPQFDLYANEGNYIGIDQYKLRISEQSCQTGPNVEPVVL